MIRRKRLLQNSEKNDQECLQPLRRHCGCWAVCLLLVVLISSLVSNIRMDHPYEYGLFRPPDFNNRNTADSQRLWNNPQDHPGLYATNDRILFVHVGKCGGNTVRAALPRLKCDTFHRRPHQEDRFAECLAKNPHPESYLQAATDTELHLTGRRDRQLQSGRYRRFLIAIRNPLTRVRSAYHFLHYNTTNSMYAQREHSDKDLFYKTCFPTWEALMESIARTFSSSTNATGSARSIPSSLQTISNAKTNEDVKMALASICQRLALVTLRGRDDPELGVDVQQINVHLAFNYEKYANKSYRVDWTRKGIPNQLYVVRTESLWKDLKDLDVFLGGSGAFDKRREGKVFDPKHRRSPFPTPGRSDRGSYTTSPEIMLPKLPNMTAIQRYHLCCILWRDLEVYQEIVLGAVNWNVREKRITIQRELVNTCNVITAPFSPWMKHTSTTRNSLIVDWSVWHTNHCNDLDRRFG